MTGILDGALLNGREFTTDFKRMLSGSAKPTLDATIEVAPQLTLTLNDPRGTLFDTGGLLDANDDELLDRDIDLVLQSNGRSVHYRIAKASWSSDTGLAVLPFEDRTSDLLRRHSSPKKMRRKRTEGASQGVTFGQWAKILVDEVKSPRIRSTIPDIDELGPISAVDLSSVAGGSDSGSRPVTDKGLDNPEKLRLKGRPLTAAQIKAVERVQTRLDLRQAPPRARLAATLAPIVEADGYQVDAKDFDTGTHRGLYQSNVIPPEQVEEQVDYFLKGGRSFGAGGAVVYAAANPNASIGQIVAAVEVSGINGSLYETDGRVSFIDEARAIVQAWGSGDADVSSYTSDRARVVVEDYFFMRGEPGKPETSWDCLGRQAEDRGQRRFVVDNRFYLASETRLFRSRSAGTISRHDVGVALSFDWAPRKKVTTVTGTLRMAPGALKPGNVNVIADLGPASGRYLVVQVTQPSGSDAATVVWRKPQNPKPEPAPEVTTDSNTSTISLAGLSLPQSGSVVDKAYAEAARIDAQNLPYGSGHGLWAQAEKAKQQDCSSYTSLILHAAGLMGGDRTQVSDWFLSWGQPGEGKRMTVWVKPGTGPNGHVMVQFHGYPKKRADTGQGSPSGPHLRADERTYAGMQPRRWPGV